MLHFHSIFKLKNHLNFNHFKKNNHFFSVDDMDSYLQYVGGTTGAIALTGIAAASAYYFATRPTPEKPLVPLHEQTLLVLEVSFGLFRLGMLHLNASNHARD
jgi:hypothetical protein